MYLLEIGMDFSGIQLVCYFGEEVFIYGSYVVSFMKRKFIVPVCMRSGCIMQQRSFSSLSFLPHGVIVQVVEKPVESIDGIVSPLRVVYGREEKVLGIHELTK